MKYLESMFILILLTFCTGTLVSSCMDSDSETGSIHETLKGAKQKAENDKDAFVEEVKEYQVKWKADYEENKEKIEALKEDKKHNIKQAYKEQVAELEIANETIKNEIDSVQVKGNLEWKNFKKSMDRELEELDESIEKFSEKKI